jgi:hypothetical protein
MSSTYSVHFDFSQHMGLGEIRPPQFTVTIGALQPDLRQGIGQLTIVCPIPEWLAQISSMGRE